MKHKITATLWAFSLFAPMLFSPINTASAQSSTPPCVVEKAKLVCASNSKEGKALLSAFSDAETHSYLQGLRFNGTVYGSPQERESFRLSVEDTYRRINRYLARALRQRKRRRMSEEEFQGLRDQYVKAQESYLQAMHIYREGTWYGSE